MGLGSSYSNFFASYSNAIVAHTEAALAENEAMENLENYIENALMSSSEDIPEPTSMEFNQYNAVVYFSFFDVSLHELSGLIGEIGCDDIIVNSSDESRNETIITLIWSEPE